MKYLRLWWKIIKPPNFEVLCGTLSDTCSAPILRQLGIDVVYSIPKSTLFTLYCPLGHFDELRIFIPPFTSRAIEPIILSLFYSLRQKANVIVKKSRLLWNANGNITQYHQHVLWFKFAFGWKLSPSWRLRKVKSLCILFLRRFQSYKFEVLRLGQLVNFLLLNLGNGMDENID